MKACFLFFLLLIGTEFLFAQHIGPDWTRQTPSAPVGSEFRYVVTEGIGDSIRAAENDAMAKVYKQIIDLNAHEFFSSEIINAVQKGVDYDVIDNKYRVWVNRSCHYCYYDSSKGVYHYFLLCQIPRKLEGDFNPNIFNEDYKHCEKYTNPYIGYSFVPGMAQIKKGSVAKGSCFIVGEIAFIGGIVVSECMRTSYVNKLKSTHNTTLHMKYTQNANNWAIARNVCIGGAVAVYVWNVIDGIVAKGKSQIHYCSTNIRIAPYAGFDNGGLAVNVQF